MGPMTTIKKAIVAVAGAAARPVGGQAAYNGGTHTAGDDSALHGRAAARHYGMENSDCPTASSGSWKYPVQMVSLF
jgi:hypothetical protein